MTASPVAVEVLRFAVAADERDAFLEVETGVWTDFLRRQDGFRAKEVWVPVDGDDVIVTIWWETLDEWKTITAGQCAAVDERMGEWLRPITEAHELHLVHRFEGRIED